jgi:hypothetical protein
VRICGIALQCAQALCGPLSPSPARTIHRSRLADLFKDARRLSPPKPHLIRRILNLLAAQASYQEQ